MRPLGGHWGAHLIGSERAFFFCPFIAIWSALDQGTRHHLACDLTICLRFKYFGDSSKAKPKKKTLEIGYLDLGCGAERAFNLVRWMWECI